MTLDILKTTTEQVTLVSVSEATPYIIEGLLSGDILDLHSCVEYVNARVDPDVNGDAVKGIFNTMVKELRRMNSEADNMASQGATVDEMEAAITGEYFTFDNIKEFKIAVYGSTVAWKAAMVSSAEV